eukprot:9470194-Pyramimonas_sp.AAC.1
MLEAKHYLWIGPPSSLPALWKELHSDACTFLPRNFSDARLAIQNQLKLNFNEATISYWHALLLEAAPNYCEYMYALEDIIMMELLQMFKLMAVPDHETNWKFDFVEGFSGRQRLSQAFRRQRLHGVALDNRYNDDLDFSKKKGFFAFLCAARCLVPGGEFWWGIECKTWVWVNRVTYGRSKENPWGKEDEAAVIAANNVSKHFVFVALILYWGRRLYTVEQPKSSLLNYVDIVQTLFGVHSVTTVNCDHGYFDDPDSAVKPLKLMGTAPFMSLMRATVPLADRTHRAKLTIEKRGKAADGSVIVKTHG